MNETMDAALKDKCDEAMALLQCLQFVVNTDDFKQYVSQPHNYLFHVINDLLEQIKSGEYE